MKIEKIDAIQLSTDDAKKYIATIINENYAQNPSIIKYLGGGSFGSAFYVQISNAEIVIKFLRAKFHSIAMQWNLFKVKVHLLTQKVGF